MFEYNSNYSDDSALGKSDLKEIRITGLPVRWKCNGAAIVKKRYYVLRCLNQSPLSFLLKILERSLKAAMFYILQFFLANRTYQNLLFPWMPRLHWTDWELQSEKPKFTRTAILQKLLLFRIRGPTFSLTQHFSEKKCF